MWLSTEAGLHRLDPANGTFRHYAHDPTDSASLSSSIVRSTYEDREGTLWVCTVVRRCLRPAHRKSKAANPPERARTLSVKVLEDHAGVLWIIYLFTGSGIGLASWDRDTQRLTLYSFAERVPPASHLSGPEGIHEDADGNLWLATRGNGLVMIDQAVGVRCDTATRRSIRTASTRTCSCRSSKTERATCGWDLRRPAWTGFEKAAALQALPPRTRQSAELFVYVRHRAYADSQENIWVGSSLGVTRIDGKSGEYTFSAQPGRLRQTSPTSVISIVEIVRATFGSARMADSNRYDPRTGRFAVFRHDPADMYSLSHDIVYSLMVDHQGALWAGTADGLSRLEDPAPAASARGGPGRLADSRSQSVR